MIYPLLLCISLSIDNQCQAEAMCNRSGSLFSNKEGLQAAVNEYISDSDAGIILYGRMNCWDVSAITDMGYLFHDKGNLNEDISCWDVSNVTNMQYMFYGASAFNQDIGRWNVSNVENMNYMFGRWQWWGTAFFNHYIGDWDVSKVKFMSGMFYRSSAFNQDLGRWNLGKALDLSFMFYEATAFNQDLCNWYKPLSSSAQPIYSSIFSYSGCPLKFELNFDLKGHFCQKCTIFGETSGRFSFDTFFLI
jgi:surface protein